MHGARGVIAAIVPAAGRSTRMGRPKLTLPLGGATVLARVVGALRGGGADPVVVVAPPADAPGAAALIAEARREGAVVVVPPAPTADMRASFECGLDHLVRGPAPEAVLLAPGDSPGVSAALVGRIVAVSRSSPGRIIVPTHAGRRGHPVLLPWPLALAVPSLPANVGVNAVLAAHAAEVIALPTGDPGTLADLDTPADYRRWGGQPTWADPAQE